MDRQDSDREVGARDRRALPESDARGPDAGHARGEALGTQGLDREDRERHGAEREGLGLEGLDLDGLRALWRERYGPPPKLRSLELLRLMLAWRIQAQACGGLDRETRRQLQRTGPLRAAGLELGIGARLTRQWQGRVVEVIVVEDGFRWQDKVYPSLSAAATAIAGTRWNGPRFFGLRTRTP